MRKSCLCALLALVLSVLLICPAGAADFRPLLEEQPLAAGDSVSDWLAIAAGRDGVRREAYLRELESYVTAMYREKDGLDRIKATEWHRVALAVLAQGGDPRSFGRDKNGRAIDLIAEGTYNWTRSGSLGMQGLNGWIFALITLDSGGFSVPEGAVYTRADMLTAILTAQLEEGGFALSDAAPADVDITAMALQALAPYCGDETRYGGVTAAEAVDRGVNWLSGQQTENGDFDSWGAPNAESTAQVMIALCSLGIDPETDPRFVKSGGSVPDGLLRYQTANGRFRHVSDGEEDLMATEQSVLALEALERLRAGEGRLYDFQDIAPLTPEKTAGSGAALWLIGGAAVLVIGTTGIIVWRKRKAHV